VQLVALGSIPSHGYQWATDRSGMAVSRVDGLEED
jgi:hypothetical protein